MGTRIENVNHETKDMKGPLVLRTFYLDRKLAVDLKKRASDENKSLSYLIYELLLLSTASENFVSNSEHEKEDDHKSMVMRTCYIPRDLVRDLKRRAFEKNKSMSDLIGDLLRCSMKNYKI